MKRSSIWILGFFFVLVLVLRLLVAFQTDDLSYDAYFTLRNIDNIKTSGLPLFIDELSYSGKHNVFSPFFYYLLALFSFIFPVVLVVKVLPAILASSIVVVVFLFANYLSKDETASLLVAGASGFIPVFFSKTINNASVYSLVIPLFFLAGYYFLLTVYNSKNLWKLITCLIFLTLTHSSSLILVFCLLIYVLLLKIQGFKKSTKESELLFFFLFLVLWFNLAIFKQSIYFHGSSVIYQNIPVQIILDSFKEITFVESLYWIGIIPLLFGVMSIYDSVFNSKKKSVSFLIAVCLSFFVLLWFRLININSGLMFLGVAVCILAAYSISKTLTYSKNLKFRFANPLLFGLLVVLIIFSSLPGLAFSVRDSAIIPSSEDKLAFFWLKENTPEDAVILVLPEEGSAMSYFAERKNVMDSNFLLVPNIDLRFKEIKNIYSDRFLTSALSKLNYYSVDYVVLSEYNRKVNNVSSLFYEDDNCIIKVYESNKEFGPEIYSVNCVFLLED